MLDLDDTVYVLRVCISNLDFTVYVFNTLCSLANSCHVARKGF